MIRKTIYVVAAVCLLFGLLGIAAADEDAQTVYGWQLMTEQERNEFRTIMRNMETEEERQAFRYEHHERMEMRAKEEGITLPDEPGEYKKGMRRGPKDGSGIGSGYGSGTGPRDGSGRGGGNGGQKGR